MSEAERNTAGFFDRAAAGVARINRRHLAWGAIVLGAIILLSVNLIGRGLLDFVAEYRVRRREATLASARPAKERPAE